MKTAVKKIEGNWDLGYALDKHVMSSTCIGNNEQGYPIFDTTRSEAGEALFQLKYRNDWNQVQPLAQELNRSIYPRFSNVGFIVPMPPSKKRHKQPVTALAEALGDLVKVPFFENLLIKNAPGEQLKDLKSKEEKLNALREAFAVKDVITNQGCWNVLIIDDLFDTGASLEAASDALRKYSKVGKIYVAALTWK